MFQHLKVLRDFQCQKLQMCETRIQTVKIKSFRSLDLKSVLQLLHTNRHITISARFLWAWNGKVGSYTCGNYLASIL